jgi:long-chain fatty acid transport protein
MKSRSTHTPLTRGLIGWTLALAAASALAAGFQLNESSGSGLGNAFAGGAAGAEDASTAWTNVAGLARLQRGQVTAAVHLITPSIKFGDGASAAATGQALGGNGGDAGGLNVVPNLYLAAPVGAGWTAGLGITAPWGLVTEYDDGWAGRFQAIKSSIQTLNINPGVAWKPSTSLSLGVGLNFQRILAEFTNQVNYSAALLNAAAANGIAPGSATFNAIAAATPGLESSAVIKGSDNASGWNVGLLWEPQQGQRFGLHYRSSIKYHVKGSVRFANPTPSVAAPLAATVAALAGGVNAAALYDSDVLSDVEMPAIANLSWFQTLGPRWAVMADLQWTGWSSIEKLTFTRSDGKLLQQTTENFKDVWKLALGATYRPGGDWLVRTGLAIDKSPVRDAWRTPRLPDGDRTWVTAGGQYRFTPTLVLDAGLGWLKSRNGSVRLNGEPPSTAAYGLLDGSYKSSTTILSAQLTQQF